MEVAVLLKVLDLAYLGFTAYMDYQDQQRQNDGVSEEIGRIRQAVLRGEMNDEQALAAIDSLIGGVVGRRRAAFEALPKPEGRS